MAKETGISWTHHTFNPWWGCTKVKLPGGRLDRCCAGCYAERDSKRYGFDLWGVEARRRFFGEAHWKEPLKWNKAAGEAGERRRVFCASMADVFEWLPDGHPDCSAMAQARVDLWAIIDTTPNLDWLILTKRIEDVFGLVPGRWGPNLWPDNLWLGTSVGAQEAAWRIDELLKYPVIVRFISYEPAYGPLVLTDEQLYPNFSTDDPRFYRANGRGLDWVITGGESGPHAAPSHPQWFRDVRDQCITTGVPFHFKQWGEWCDIVQATQLTPIPTARDAGRIHRWENGDVSVKIGKTRAGHLLDGKEWLQFPNPDREAYNAQKKR